ncbi:glycosyltransferase [Streptomyces sp. NPDC020794]|uniref:glycosyltransferase n=1 Tax=unclassified Streptomyces TaxID=2593676 RepID=UPI0036E2D4DF
MSTRPLTASRSTSRLLTGTALAIAALAAWAVRHVASSMATWQGHGAQFATIYTLAFGLLVWQVCLYSLERPRKTTARQQAQLDRLRVCIPIPLYNEDPGYLHKCLVSILRQTRLPQWVYVVDDGSKVDYTAEQAWFEQACAQAGVRLTWQRTENGGKRHAQGHAVRATAADTDVYVTVDSDANLAPDAIDELLKPFADREIQSVAGIVLAENNRKNLLTRVTDLWFVVGQLVDRSALSTMGAVLVNSGVLAAYRAGLVVDNLDGYLSETFFGRRVEFSDDSMLTIYALQRGKAVQQPSAFAFTAMPENLSHHLRQYLRWMRGAFIRTWWRFKYLPLNGYAYWGHFFGWVQMALSTVIFSLLFVVYPAVTVHFDPLLLLVPALIGYGQALRYLSFRRSDETLASQLWTFALAPLALLWSFFVLRVVRWYAMATCLKTGWGTRQHGAEVTAESAPTPAVVLPDDDTVRIPRAPLAKLLDPDTEDTLQIALPIR